MTWNKRLLLAVFLLIAVVFATTIEIDPPKEFRGTMQVNARITGCDFSPLRRSPLFFFGVRVDDQTAPYLRMNPKKMERSRFEDICRAKAYVRITYIAKKRIIGPVRFWIQSIDVA